MDRNLQWRLMALAAATVLNLALAVGLHTVAVEHQAPVTMAGDTLPTAQRVAAQPTHGG